ncbi:MAG: serine hydrolase family protein [Chelatococcus sp.]|uniref:RBBP9/YdeN family alpha/beta hydrolase n=1 Tax=unclassified Chelatococcus TaxID=2638111 RepID=UPI001BD0BB55|nr:MULTISPECIES: alpha/beta hydrolase [unclassified Chelatococcus]CAH1658218.1 conserved hypothetical protein [Hyphomicrobiales bacterium]MBS7742202.1 serine hydrolase family protein [Chelatococcus sp. HY11]MBX3539146.1 serine hydrolase family protein [Chelatococcus sp.]MBX3542680.1 serine hydrolase family protein [Chelatococcus sp.]MCO5075104.1 alpha/beta hydrolase [Chelatococcus sp.]
MQRFILPGWHGSGAGHWQRLWLKHDPAAVIVEQDDWANPDREAWLARLDAALAGANEAMLIAHSLGVILVAHHAATRPLSPVRAALLVAPGDADLHAPANPPIASFAPMPRAPLPYPSTMVLSRTDPHMSFARSTELARDLGSSVVDLDDAGHINVDSGFGPWPLGFELADALQKRCKE